MNWLKDFIARHRKLIVFAAGACVTLATQIWGADNQWVSLAVLVATGLGVYGVRNRPAAPAGGGK